MSPEVAGAADRAPDLARPSAARPMLRRASMAYMLDSLADSEDTIQRKSQAEPRRSDAARRCDAQGIRCRRLSSWVFKSFARLRRSTRLLKSADHLFCHNLGCTWPVGAAHLGVLT